MSKEAEQILFEVEEQHDKEAEEKIRDLWWEVICVIEEILKEEQCRSSQET